MQRPHRTGCLTLNFPLLVALLLLVASPRAVADTVRLINGPADALSTAMRMVDGANHRIVVTTYVLDNGTVAQTVLRHLIAASRRGVQVRVLVDGFEDPLPVDWVRLLQCNGVCVRVYNPPCLLRPVQLNYRLHAKMLVVDRDRGLIGSRNWQDSHYGLDREKSFLDQDVEITGEIARQMDTYFDRIWNFDRVVAASSEQRRRWDVWNWDKGSSEVSASIMLGGCDAEPPRPYPICQVKSPSFVVESLQLLRDTDEDKSRRRFSRSVRELIDSARYDITIETPYPALHRLTIKALSRATERGVGVTILTNSLSTTDQTSVYATYQNHKRGLLKKGIRLLEIGGDQVMHSKTMIIDDHTSMVGSYNFDYRSDRFNIENAIVVRDRAFTEALERRVVRRARDAVQIVNQPILSVGPGASTRRRIELFRRRFVVLIYARCL